MKKIKYIKGGKLISSDSNNKARPERFGSDGSEISVLDKTKKKAIDSVEVKRIESAADILNKKKKVKKEDYSRFISTEEDIVVLKGNKEDKTDSDDKHQEENKKPLKRKKTIKNNIKKSFVDVNEFLKAQEKLIGGKADKENLDDIAKKSGKSLVFLRKQLKLGMKVESEHTKDKQVQKEIVMDHLADDCDYYTKAKPKDWAKKELEEEDEKIEKGFFSDLDIELKNADCACAVVYNEKVNSILLGVSNAEGDRNGKWCFTGGHRLNFSEDIKYTAKREAFEESEIICNPTDIIVIDEEKPNVAFVLCEYEEGNATPQKYPEQEFLEFAWFDIDNLPDNMMELNKRVIFKIFGYDNKE